MNRSSVGTTVARRHHFWLVGILTGGWGQWPTSKRLQRNLEMMPLA